MGRLFHRPDGSPMPFYLTELPEKLLERFTNLIELNGGTVESNPKENVLTFTVPSHSYNYKYVFDVKFIEDCVENKRILDIDQYYLGDSRIVRGCPISKAIFRTKTCLLNQLGVVRTCESVIVPNELELRIQKEHPQQDSKRTMELSPVSTRRKPAEIVRNIDEEVPPEIDQNKELDYEPYLSDSFESFMDSEDDKVSDYEEEIELPNRERNLVLLKDIVTEELEEWIENLNKGKAKDSNGYLKKLGRSYSPWESRNLIMFVIKTNTYHLVNRERYWMEVVQLKLLPNSRKYKSAYKHFLCQILPKIEQFHLAPVIEAKFIKWRNKFEANKQERLEKQNQKELANKKKKKS